MFKMDENIKIGDHHKASSLEYHIGIETIKRFSVTNVHYIYSMKFF